jgi:GNAT superfamily N-acetyltransferase
VSPFTADDRACGYHQRMTIYVPTTSIPGPLVRQLGPGHRAAIAVLQAAVTAELPPYFLRGKSEADLHHYLDGTHGAAYGIVEDDHLLAMALLRLPSQAHPNAKGDPPFPIVPAADWPCHAAFLENAVVLPAARGRGYQRALLDVRMFRAAVSGMRWICSGANLRNEQSWTNLLSCGMAIVGMIDIGFPLLGLLTAVDAPDLATDPRDRIAVPVQDRARHQAVLRDGYIGVRRMPDGGHVIYQRRV